MMSKPSRVDCAANGGPNLAWRNSLDFFGDLFYIFAWRHKAPEFRMPESYEKDEYFALVRSVADFDQRLLTVKGWGVTLSLAALGLGFQYRAYGFFMIAAASSLAFWMIEHAGKRHQMRHYVRIREIEVAQYARAPEEEKAFSSPRTDWSWHTAGKTLDGATDRHLLPVEHRRRDKWYAAAGLLPHVVLPHAITLAIGLFLFWQGLTGHLPAFTLGNAPSPGT